MDSQLIYKYFERNKEIEQLIYKKRFKLALLASIIIHILILYLIFPSSGKNLSQQKNKRKYIVIKDFYKLPKKIKKKRIRKKSPIPKKVNINVIPDPTPNEPEIIPEENSQIDLEPEEIFPRDTEIIFKPPENPPSLGTKGPIFVKGDVIPPVCIKKVKPKYPEVAKRAKIEGIVIIQAIINKEGKVVSARVIKGLGKALNEAALEAVYKWEFTPATLNGVPVDVYFNLTVVFKLK